MTLTETLVSQHAASITEQAIALLLAAPRIRAAEHIESVLRSAGIEAGALAETTGGHIAITVVANSTEQQAAEALTLAGIAFDRHPAMPHHLADAYLDCEVATYNVTVIIATPYWLKKAQVAT